MKKLSERTKEIGGELRVALGDQIEESLKTNKKIMLLDADLCGASFFNRFRDKYPKNFIECGICEANMIGVAAGLSMRGYTPFVHTMAAFVTRRALDQLYLSCAYSKNTINIYASDPGFTVGFDGGSHTTFEDLAILKAIPNAIVCDPCDCVQIKWMAKTLLEKNDGAIHYIRAHRKGVRPIYDENEKFELGKGKILNKGTDILLVASGFIMGDALDAAEMLEKDGISVEVIDPVTIKPFDEKLIAKEAKGKKLIVTYENHGVINGLGSSVADVLAEKAIAVPLYKIGANDVFGQVGTVDKLKYAFELDGKSAYKKILKKYKSIK